MYHGTLIKKYAPTRLVDHMLKPDPVIKLLDDCTTVLVAIVYGNNLYFCTNRFDTLFLIILFYYNYSNKSKNYILNKTISKYINFT